MVLSVSLLTNCYTWKLMTRESITTKERLLLSPASIHLNCPYQLSISRAIDWYTSYTKRSRGTVNVTKSKRLATMRRVASPSFHPSINKTEPQSKNVTIKMNYPFLAPPMWIQIIYVLQKKKDALFKYITVLTRYSIHSFEFTTTVAVGFDPKEILVKSSHLSVKQSFRSIRSFSWNSYKRKPTNLKIWECLQNQKIWVGVYNLHPRQETRWFVSFRHCFQWTLSI